MMLYRFMSFPMMPEKKEKRRGGNGQTTWNGGFARIASGRPPPPPPLMPQPSHALRLYWSLQTSKSDSPPNCCVASRQLRGGRHVGDAGDEALHSPQQPGLPLLALEHGRHRPPYPRI